MITSPEGWLVMPISIDIDNGNITTVTCRLQQGTVKTYRLYQLHHQDGMPGLLTELRRYIPDDGDGELENN